ncbi:MAG: hypothetical protein ACE5ES_02410 [Candidatus Nanoarchaeia archaeon]
MGLFGFGKKDSVIDLTKQYKKQQEKAAEIQADSSLEGSKSPVASGFGFLGNLAGAGSDSRNNSNDVVDLSSRTPSLESNEEKRRRLTKRLMDITSKLEDLNNQIYHLQQRVELLERKTGVR